jgi:hypothetical protein
LPAEKIKQEIPANPCIVPCLLVETPPFWAQPAEFAARSKNIRCNIPCGSEFVPTNTSAQFSILFQISAKPDPTIVVERKV